MSIAPNRARAALSLVEAVVSSALMLLIMTGVYQMVTKGYQFYRVNQAATDAQRNGLALLTKLNNVIQNAKPAYIAIDPANKGISYCSPFDDAGKVLFNLDATTNVSRVVWQAYESLYLTPEKKVFLGRKKIAVPSFSVLTPDDPGASAMPSNFLMTGKGRFVAENVTRFEITNIPKGAPLPLPPPAPPTLAANDCYTVIFEAGNQNDPSGYWLRLECTVTPRNQ